MTKGRKDAYTFLEPHRVQYTRCVRCGIDVEPSAKWGRMCKDCRVVENRERREQEVAARVVIEPQPEPTTPTPNDPRLAALIAEAEKVVEHLSAPKPTRLRTRLDIDDAAITRCPECDAMVLPAKRMRTPHECVQTVARVEQERAS